MHIFQRCGHWAQVEHQEEFEQLVLNFLKSWAISETPVLLRAAAKLKIDNSAFVRRTNKSVESPSS